MCRGVQPAVVVAERSPDSGDGEAARLSGGCGSDAVPCRVGRANGGRRLGKVARGSTRVLHFDEAERWAESDPPDRWTAGPLGRGSREGSRSVRSLPGSAHGRGLVRRPSGAEVPSPSRGRPTRARGGCYRRAGTGCRSRHDPGDRAAAGVRSESMSHAVLARRLQRARPTDTSAGRVRSSHGPLTAEGDRPGAGVDGCRLPRGQRRLSRELDG